MRAAHPEDTYSVVQPETLKRLSNLSCQQKEELQDLLRTLLLTSPKERQRFKEWLQKLQE